MNLLADAKNTCKAELIVGDWKYCCQVTAISALGSLGPDAFTMSFLVTGPPDKVAVFKDGERGARR